MDSHPDSNILDYLRKIGDWEVLCSHFKVQQSTVAAFQQSPQMLTLYDCLKVFKDSGELMSYSCWEKVVSTVCGAPFLKKLLGHSEEAATDHQYTPLHYPNPI